jgi:hypothetical protein
MIHHFPNKGYPVKLQERHNGIVVAIGTCRHKNYQFDSCLCLDVPDITL